MTDAPAVSRANVLELHGIAQANRDLPRAFHALHHKVPSLRADLLRQLAPAEPPPSSN